ncbi:MAG: ABC-2 transporter permease [Verrucomicrobiae bacterium]|nr:ABC-2 transporter permease [Verrucomicrobiae bacterium]
MRQFIAIAANAFMELVRQPVYLLLMTSAAAFEIFLATPYYFAFGDEPKLVKNSVLAVIFLAGLLGAVLSASASLSRELRSGTALAVLSKPVGRAQFLIAKYVGVIAALTIMVYVMTVAALVASRMAFDAYGKTDLAAVGIFALGLVAAYAFGGFVNFFLQKPFVSATVAALVVTVTLAAFVIVQFTEQMQSLGQAATVDWRLVPAAILILFAVWVLAALALACSTRLDMIPTLAVCSAFFLLGLMSDYLFGRRAQPVWVQNLRVELISPRWSPEQKNLLKTILARYDTNNSGRLEPSEQDSITAQDKAALIEAGLGGSRLAGVLYTLTPNWQLFWTADVLETGKTGFPWSYVGKAAIYMMCYVAAALAVAVVLFEERELT